MEEVHGWYSCRQFAALNSNNKTTKNRHLYYINEKGDSVEITMVSKTKNHGTGYNDMEYLGKLTKFHKVEYKS